MSRPSEGLYWCGRCEQLLAKDCFYSSRSRSTGVSHRCKPCSSADAVDWRKANPEKASAALARHRATERHRETQKSWREKNRDKMAKYMREWRTDKSYCAFTRGKSRAGRAMPSWADKNAIADVYKKAMDMRLETGQEWHVDHIIPLNGKFVSGLHVAENLRVIPAEENRRKRNKFEEDQQ